MTRRNTCSARRSRLIVTAWVLVLAALTQLVACGGGGGDGSSDDRPARYKAALEAGGFSVGVGGIPTKYPMSLVDEHVLNSAGGNNAGQPYKVLQAPAVPGDGTSGKDNENAILRLGENEALVYIGPTPPQCDYFSFTPFLWVRKVGSWSPRGDWLFAALGDPLNHKTLKTEQGGAPFGKTTMVIFAADQNVYNKVAALAQQAGYPESMINAYVLPSALLKLNQADPANNDSLLMLLRTANFANTAEGQAYLDNTQYATVYRVTPTTRLKLDPLPFPTPVLRPRGWLHENQLVNLDLDAALDDLGKAIMKKHSAFPKARPFGSIRWFVDSRELLYASQRSSLDPLGHQFAAGEASDTPYLRTAEGSKCANFTLGNDDLVVAYGVNHAATGLAIYSMFGVYGDWILDPNTGPDPHNQCPGDWLSYPYVYGCGQYLWNGVVGMNSDSEYFGSSVSQYLPNHPAAKYLYAIKVLRNAPSKDDPSYNYSVVVPREPDTSPGTYPRQGPAYAISLDKPITLGYRAYVNPATNVGPAYTDIVYDRAIWFGQKAGASAQCEPVQATVAARAVPTVVQNSGGVAGSVDVSMPSHN